MSKHTPGPWKADGVNVFAEADWHGTPVAAVSVVGKPAHKANARLIAAGPELLKACEFAVLALKDHIQYDDGESLERDAFNAAQAAIAKAEP